MKKLRFVLGLLLVLSMVFVFASCGKGGSKGGTINFWMQKYGGQDPANQQNYVNRIVEQFKKDTGITVNTTLIDWGQALTKYTLAASGGEAPDVAETFFAYSWHKIGGEKYGPMIIDDVVAEVGEGFYDIAKPECFFDGHWYALHWRGDTRAAAYNQQMFDEAGIRQFPKTYDELIEVGKRLTTYNADGSVDRAGYMFSIGSARFDQTWFSLLAGHGGAMMDPTFTRWTLDTNPVRESLKFMYDSVFTYNIVPTSVIDPSYESGPVFMAGKAAIVLGVTPDFYVNVKMNAPQILQYTKSAVMPSKTGSGISSIAFAAPVCVFKTTKNVDSAKKWLKFFCTKDVQLDAMKQLGLVNSWLDVMNDPYFQNDPWYKPFTEQTKRANPGDMPISEFSEIDAFPSGPLNTMCTQVMAGGNVQAAINECIAKINVIMGR